MKKPLVKLFLIVLSLLIALCSFTACGGNGDDINLPSVDNGAGGDDGNGDYIGDNEGSFGDIGNNPNSHKHDFCKQNTDNKYLASTPTCTEKATYYYSCECGKKSYVDVFEYGEFAHEYEDYECILCGDKIPRTVYFGRYPQTRVTDENTIVALSNIAGNPMDSVVGWTNYGYFESGSRNDCMYYRDITINGDSYRGVFIKRYRPYLSTYTSADWSNGQLSLGYVKESVYWFKYEPLEWLILNQVGDTYTLLCNAVIDSQEYDFNENKTFDNNYKNSLIRAWLNYNFYFLAFNDKEKEQILVTEVDNSSQSTDCFYNQYACENTFDKVFLLSCEEVYLLTTNKLCQKVVTDYAQSQGASLDASGYGYWWLRSPHFKLDDLAGTIYPDGKVYFDYYSDFVVRNYVSVVPAINAKL